ncbi:MAG: hypothetical protein QM811_10590 [Pirellulales bacterium]
MFAPLHYEPNYAYPLIVWLHSAGNYETQLNDVMPHVSLRNYVAVAARGTVAEDRGCDWSQSDLQIRRAERRVFKCLEVAKRRYHVAEPRIFLAGLESGGTMALRIGLRNPSLFAGAISIGGEFPRDGAPLSKLDDARRLPLLLTSSKESTLYPESAVCEDLRLFHSAGMKVMVRQYPGEDGVTDLMLADMDRWIMEAVTRPAEHDDVAVGTQAF